MSALGAAVGIIEAYSSKRRLYECTERLWHMLCLYWWDSDLLSACNSNVAEVTQMVVPPGDQPITLKAIGSVDETFFFETTYISQDACYFGPCHTVGLAEEGVHTATT